MAGAVESSATVKSWRGEAAVVLAAGGYEAVFLPDLGLLGASLAFEGRELLSLHGGLAGYRDRHVTGFPLLAPWANRLSQDRFRVAGKRVDLTKADVHRDGNGLAIHGTVTALPGWRIHRLRPARLDAVLDYDRPELLAAFPFRHRLEVSVALSERGLGIETAVVAPEDGPVPVSFGWHPYFRVAGPRTRWLLGLPALAHLELDERAIPTGRSAEQRAERRPLGDRIFDDLYVLRGRRFSLEGRSGGVVLRFGRGYEFAQVYAPPGRSFVAIEPMTAPIDGLVTGSYPVAPPGGRFAARFTVWATRT
jgi:galactose mutarotase-like enzyme